MIKHRLPPREVLDRYAPTVRFNIINGYHRKLASKHRWYVREWEGDFYYTDGDDLPTVEGEMFDCRWSPAEWNTRPYKYNVTNGMVTEEYRSFSAKPWPDDYLSSAIGYRRNGEWLMKIYNDGKRWFVRDKHGWHTNYCGFYVRYSEVTGELTAGKFSNMKLVKTAPDKEILPVLRGMKSVKWRGFYDEDVEHVAKIAKVDRRYL